MNDQAIVPTGNNMFFDVLAFEQAQRVAKMFSLSTMVPEHFQNNIGNCMIAMDFANRIGANIFMTMQNMYVIHGKPGIEGKLVIALVNQCGRFEPLEFEEGKDFCVAVAKDIKSGKILKGTKITIEMVKKEGWWQKKGSKWQTMPEQMYRYRAATFFARTYCSEVLLGMQTREELQDVGPIDVTPTETKAAELTERLKGARIIEEMSEKIQKDGFLHQEPEVDMRTGEILDPPFEPDKPEREYRYNDKGSREPVDRGEDIETPPDQEQTLDEKFAICSELLSESDINKVLQGKKFTDFGAEDQESILAVLNAQVDLKAKEQEAK